MWEKLAHSPMIQQDWEEFEVCALQLDDLYRERRDAEEVGNAGLAKAIAGRIKEVIANRDRLLCRIGHELSAADRSRRADIAIQAVEAINSTFYRTRPMAPRILLTEDDEDVRDLVESVLIDEGYKVDAIDTVAGALSLLDSQPYDLLFTDGMLPDGTGLTVANKAKQRDIKVVVFTGFADAFPAEQLARYTVLRKPADIDHVVRTVAQAIAA